MKMLAVTNRWGLLDNPIPTFRDGASAHSFYRYIETAAAWGVISGYSDGTFRPNAPITRGQLAKVVVSAMAWPIESSAGPRFSDVPASDPFYQYIETARANRLISGYADGSFHPGTAATRAQIAKIIVAAVPNP